MPSVKCYFFGGGVVCVCVHVCVHSSPGAHYKVVLMLLKEATEEIDLVCKLLRFPEVCVCVCVRDIASSHLSDGACKAG